MVESLVESFLSVLSGWGITGDLVIFIISMVPILELRGGMIAAAILHISYVRAACICVLGNIIPIPFILLLITKIFDLLRKIKISRPIVEWCEKQAMGKSEKIKKYEFIGLLLFVGIPLPGTGAWTGALIAALLGIKLKRAVPAIGLGVLMALAIMSVITYGIPALVRLF